ncbi:MAG: lysophospholipid acyltransferase family protein [Cyanobacteriota bacterium]
MQVTAQIALIERQRNLCNGISPWLGPIAMVVTQDLVLPGFFGDVQVHGQQHLPQAGPVLLAPTHRARWDALMLPFGAGRRVTGRDCRFMVSSDEMTGLQGWCLHRLGCFPVDTRRAGPASLRYALDLLHQGEQLVMFPEGRIQQSDGPISLRPGLSRLVQLAAGQGVAVPVIPVGIAYAHARPRWRDRAAICFGEAQHLNRPDRESARSFTQSAAEAMRAAEKVARTLVGRPLTGT